MSWLDQYKEEQILIHTGSGHNKFWSARWDPATGKVHIRWGRLGTSGQSQIKEFKSQYDASRFVSRKCDEKSCKGYTDTVNGTKIDHQLFEKMTIEAAIVGTQNKCHEMQWVEIIDEASGRFEPITEDRLFSPDCNPGMLVELETRKEYDGDTKFRLLFTFDKCFKVRNNSIVPVTQSSDLYKMTQKVEEAIGRSLSTV